MKHENANEITTDAVAAGAAAFVFTTVFTVVATVAAAEAAAVAAAPAAAPAAASVSEEKKIRTLNVWVFGKIILHVGVVLKRLTFDSKLLMCCCMKCLIHRF